MECKGQHEIDTTVGHIHKRGERGMGIFDVGMTIRLKEECGGRIVGVV